MTPVKTYKEFLKEHITYSSNAKCFISGCTKPGLYEGGDARFYCGMCEEHAGMRKSYELYMAEIERQNYIRKLWDKT